MSSNEDWRNYDLPDWVRVEEDLLAQEWNRITQEASQFSRPQLQKVPGYMFERVEFQKFYCVQVFSIGPLRYNFAPQLWAIGEPYKYKWTAMYLSRTNQTIKDLHIRISTHERELFEQCTVDYAGLRPFILDGCSILQVLEKSNNSVDAEQELKISIDKLVQVHRDLVIMDNQFPFQELRLLCNNETRFKRCLQNFLEIHGIKPDAGKEKGNKDTHNGQELKLIVNQQSIEDDPIHLLDYLRRALLKRNLAQIHKEVEFKRKSLHLRKYRIGTVQELKAAGIHLKKDPNNTTFYPSFKDGILYLPELTVDGSTPHIFLNLMAYEMCPDFRNDLEITSYVVFMSSLIDQPEDVKVLRSAGILINELANDKQVADLFNKMDSVLVPETSRFAVIRDGIQDHFETKRNKIKMLGWMGEAYETYLRSPWTVIALLAGSLALVLTLIQTWFAIHPKG